MTTPTDTLADDQRPATRGDLAQLEARVDLRFEHVDLRFTNLETHMADRFRAVDTRFDDFETRMADRFRAVDARFTGIDTRLDAMHTRLGGMDTRFTGIDNRLAGIDKRLEGMGDRLERISDQGIRTTAEVAAVREAMGGLTERLSLMVESVEHEILGTVERVTHQQTKAIVFGLGGLIVPVLVAVLTAAIALR